jgi:FKBP-type peptidyl-prolyl cis-trans isomerase
MFMRFMAVLAVTLLVTGCSGEPKKSAAGGPPPIPAPADVAAPPADATRTPSGIAFKVLTPGTGTRHPRPNSRVRVHYTGWTTDGMMFDSSVARNEPITFGLDEVIPGWTQGVQMMVEGEKRRFWIPEDLAYRGADPKGMLVFEIELIRIES